MAGQVLKAYAIFDGGGVLAAALAGALKAAERDIEFVGFGGTSGGSLVAALAAVGYSGAELEAILVNEPFTSWLDDDGGPVRDFKQTTDTIAKALDRGGLRGTLTALWMLRRLSRTLRTSFGVDSGEALTRGLLAKIRAKWPDRFETAVDVSFAKLAELESKDGTRPGCFPLKIVASDVGRRKPVIFSKKDTDYSHSVLHAVRASTCYPFVFQPFGSDGETRLVDGGLASNLPAFLFHEEQRRTKFPVFAFDLVPAKAKTEAKPAATAAPYTLQRFVREMISTALDAGDELLRKVLRDVVHVPIEIPDEDRFDVLNFDINPRDRGDLFKLGFQQTQSFLNEHKKLQLAKREVAAREAILDLNPQDRDRILEEILQKQLQARYGDPKPFEPILASIARDFEASTKARSIRAAIMLISGRLIDNTPTRIVVYHHGLTTDATLELPRDAGCSGRAWKARVPIWANLTASREDHEHWGMTRAQHDRVPLDRQAMLSTPIWGYPDAEKEAKDDPTVEPIGTLSIDSSTPLADTGWLEGPSSLRAEVAKRMAYWENVIRKLLQ